MKKLFYCEFSEFKTQTGFVYKNFEISYQLFGKPLHKAPIILVLHPLTANSNVAGKKGWWQKIISKKGTIDLEKYTVIAFNILGNGYDEKPENLIYNYEDFSCKDLAFIFKKALEKLNIQKLHSIMGASLGGMIAWEFLMRFPKFSEQYIFISTDWKTTDWILGYVQVQKQILQNSRFPMHDARMMGMLFFRSPESFAEKFKNQKEEKSNIPKVKSWLFHHAKTIENRYTLPAYKMVTHLKTTCKMGYTKKDFKDFAKKIQAKIIQIAVDSDLLYPSKENKKTHQILKKMKKNSYYEEMKSIHGHDSFLIEYEQLKTILKNYF